MFERETQLASTETSSLHCCMQNYFHSFAISPCRGTTVRASENKYSESLGFKSQLVPDFSVDSFSLSPAAYVNHLFTNNVASYYIPLQ